MAQLEEDRHSPPTGLPEDLRGHLFEVAVRDRWDRLFLALGGLHLAFFGLAQWLVLQPWHPNWPFVCFWLLEAGAVLVLLRQLAGPCWYRSSPLAGVLLRVWGTYLLVCFGAATLNVRTGLDHTWYKLSWASLATFGWAASAALLGWRFLIPAVQMYFTGLLMTRYPDWSFLIFGVSWCLALLGLAVVVAWARAGEGEADRSASAVRHSRDPWMEASRHPG